LTRVKRASQTLSTVQRGAWILLYRRGVENSARKFMAPSSRPSFAR
jgi:hypothetical protein